jgi:hypothetical protein
MIAKNFAGLKTRLWLLALPVLLISASPYPVNACSCYRKLAPCEEFPQASAVFIGKVIDSAKQVTEFSYYGNKKTYVVGIIRSRAMKIKSWSSYRRETKKKADLGYRGFEGA